jgi:hypothetical protein
MEKQINIKAPNHPRFNYEVELLKNVFDAEDIIEISVSIKEDAFKSNDIDYVEFQPVIGGEKISKKFKLTDENNSHVIKINASEYYVAGESKSVELLQSVKFNSTPNVHSCNPDNIGQIYFKEVKEVRLTRPSLQKESKNKNLWEHIKKHAIDFEKYSEIIDDLMACHTSIYRSTSGQDGDKKRDKKRLPFIGVDAYSLLKFSTELYIKNKCGIKYDDTILSGYLNGNKILPYLDKIIEKLKWNVSEKDSACFGNDEIEKQKVKPFLIELIYNYWHEEGFFNKTLEAISTRFQNIRRSGVDALARLDIDPLRPLSNILWGYIQDTQHRLNSVRRTLEYDHEYGLKLIGKGVPQVNTVDSRSKFIEAFHNLLFKSTVYHNASDDMTKYADGFPVLNALKEVHLLLAEGAHNQFGDLPMTARSEIMMEQWILARPEIREFLGGRPMYPYSEPWMDRVDTMKVLQGWTDTSISYFNKLAKYGEQIILSIRYDEWNEIDDAQTAGDWAKEWRNEIQQYIHSYFAVTGVDLSADMYAASSDKFVMPSYLIQRKLSAQIASKGTVYYGQR